MRGAIVSAAIIVGAPLTAQTSAEHDARIKEAAAVQAQAEAEKAKWDAIAAERTARREAFEAATEPLSGLNAATGETKTGTNGGEVEALMLATPAALEAADRIAGQVRPNLKSGPVYLVAGDQAFGTNAWAAFDAKARGVAQALGAQGCAPPTSAEAAPTSAEAAAVPFAAAVGLAAQLLKTDLTVTGIKMTADQTLLLRAVASKLPQRARMPWAAFGDVLAGSEVEKRIGALMAQHACVEGKLKDAAVAPKPDAERIAALKTASARFSAFLAAATTPDANGRVELVEAARQHAIATDEGATVLRVNVHQMGGSLFTRKNLWTAFGLGKPLQVSSGLVASFEQTDRTGTVLAAGTVACASGFHRLADVHRKANLVVTACNP